MYKLVIEPCKITGKSANFDHSMLPTRKIYLNLHVARNILVSRLLVSFSRHSNVQSEGLLPDCSYSSLDPTSEPVQFSPCIMARFNIIFILAFSSLNFCLPSGFILFIYLFCIHVCPMLEPVISGS
jgi:hypothetical protein